MKIILQFYKYGLFLLLVVLNSPAFSQYLDFKRYSLEQGLSLTQTTDLLQLDNGYLVVGTYGEGLNFFNGSKFTEFDKEDGLSDDYVYSLLLDDDGKVWIGTSNGLNVFDGKSFTVYTSQEGLSDNAIWSLAKLNDQILIGTEYGITIYNKSDEKFSQINNEDINNSVIWDMYYGADNVLYIGTDNGLYTAEEGNLSNIKKTDDFNTLMIYKITQDSDTNLLLGSSNGVYIQTGNTFKNITNKNGLPDNEIYDIKEEEKGMFWIGSYKGLSKIVDGKVAFVSPRFQNNSIWTIIYDNEQNLWISGDDGLYILKNDNFIAFGNQYDRKISAWEIDQTKDGRIYAATQNEGIQILDGNKFYPAPYNEEFSKEIFNSIAEKDGMMYYGSETGLYRYDGTNVAKLMPPDGYKSIDVLNLFNDSQNTLWIGSGYSGIFFLKNNEIKSLSEVSDLYMGSLNAALEDKSGTLWFATSYGLFYRDSTGEFKQSDLLKNSDVISLLEDSRGNFWASIYDQGVVFIDRTNNISDTISADDGLNHISILSTVIDNQGYLWIGTNHGLNRFDLEKYYESKEIDILAYSIKDGFPGSELVENTLLVDNDGFIWYASVAGIIRFNPKEIEPVHYSPPIYITSISINNRPYKEKESINLLSEKIIVKDKIELPSFDAALSLSFQAVSYYEAEKLKYSYRMSDGEWSEPTERNYVDYY
ncbi:MAG: hypothetical protein K9J16_18645, partial [Melioribacteraceae bacterium]|nr:hypothetical protein [Melioribacteraceae bacterium]